MKSNIPLLYVFVYKKMREAAVNSEVDYSKVMALLGYVFHIPEDIRVSILKEMEKLKLIKQITIQKVKILPHKCVNGIKAFKEDLLDETLKEMKGGKRK